MFQGALVAGDGNADGMRLGLAAQLALPALLGGVAMALHGPGLAIIAAMSIQTARSVRRLLAARDSRLFAALVAMSIPALLSDVSAVVYVGGREYVVTPLEVKAITVMSQVNAVAQLAKPGVRARLASALRRVRRALKL